MNSTRLGPENDCAGEVQQQIVNDTSFHLRGCYIRTRTASVQLGGKKLLAMSLKGLVANMNWLAVNRQS
jgi:hypothetical protein